MIPNRGSGVRGPQLLQTHHLTIVPSEVVTKYLHNLLRIAQTKTGLETLKEKERKYLHIRQNTALTIILLRVNLIVSDRYAALIQLSSRTFLEKMMIKNVMETIL